MAQSPFAVPLRQVASLMWQSAGFTPSSRDCVRARERACVLSSYAVAVTQQVGAHKLSG